MVMMMRRIIGRIKHVPGLQAFESADPQQKQALEKQDLQTHRGRPWDIRSLLPLDF